MYNVTQLLAHGGGTGVTWLRWSARLVAVLLFLLWGAFFVEHTGDYFSHPGKLPPPWVLGLHGLHFALLVGLLIGWRWELAGGLLVVAATLTFFPMVAGVRAGWFIAVTIIPGILWLICAWRTAAATGPAMQP